MSVALITGSAGLIGSEACRRFHAEGLEVAGIDNDMRAQFFGEGASTAGMREKLERTLPDYTHYGVDIREVVEYLIADLFPLNRDCQRWKQQIRISGGGDHNGASGLRAGADGISGTSIHERGENHQSNRPV